jgi:PleD family two-component response regulator
MAGESERGPGGASNVVPEHLFRYLLDLEVEKAARLRYCVSVLCLAPDLEGGETDRELTQHIAVEAARRLRRTDVATLLDDGSVAVMLPDADPEALPSILDRTADAHESGGRRFVRGARQVSLSVGGGCYPVTATSAPAVLRQARQLMGRATQQGGNRLVLPRES